MEFDIGEVNPIAALLGLGAGVVGFITANNMSGGIFIKIASFLLCAVVGFFVGNKILNSG